MNSTARYTDAMHIKSSEEHYRGQKAVVEIHRLRSIFRLEQTRLVSHRNDPDVATYLSALSFGFVVQEVKTPTSRHQLHAHTATFGSTSYKQVHFECWSVPRELLLTLSDVLRDGKPPNEVIVKTVCLENPSIWASKEITITEDAGFPPNHLWLCPVRIWGQTREGADFLHDLVTPFAEDLRQSKAGLQD